MHVSFPFLQYLFVDSTNNYLWNTFDFCSSVQGFSLSFKPTDLLLHSQTAGLVLGYDASHPNKQVTLSAITLSAGGGNACKRDWWKCVKAF